MSPRARALVALVLMAALLVVASQLRRTDDLTRLLPASGELGDAARAALAHQGADVVLFEVDGRGASREALASAVDRVSEAARASGRFERVRARVDHGDGVALRRVALQHAVTLLPEELLRERTSEEGVHEILEAWRARLAGPAGALALRGLQEDPLDLGALALQRLRSDAGPWSVEVEAGLFLDPSGERALVLAIPEQRALAGAEDQSFVEAAEAVTEASPLPVRWFGGPRIATDMASSVQRDVALSSGLAAVALLFVLFAGFRSLRLVAGLILPISLAVASVGAALALRSPVHGVTLGFGGALLGVTVDYWVHLAVSATRIYDGPDSRRRVAAALQAWREIRPSALTSALTTCAAFAILLLSRFPVVQDLGAAGIAAVLGAVTGTALLGPLAYGLVGGREVAWRPPHLPPVAGLVTLLLTALLAIAATGVRFEGDPRRLLAVSEETATLEREIAARYGGVGTHGLMVVTPWPGLDRALDLAAQATEALRDLPGVTVSGPTPLLPGPELAARRRAALPAPNTLEARVADAALAVGLRPEALLPALASYYAPTTPSVDTWEGTPLQDLVSGTVSEEGLSLEVLFVDPAMLPEARRRLPDGVTLVVPAALAAEGVEAIRDELVSLGALAVALIATILLVRYRDPGRVLAAALPPAAAVAWTLGAVALVGWPLNAVGASVLVLILGLAVDYGIFLADNREHGISVGLAAATTLAGFGTLLVSRSPALAGAGLVVLAGLGGAALVALTVTPRVADGTLLGRTGRRWARGAVLAAIVALHVQVLVVLRFVVPAPPASEVSLPEPVRLEGDDRRLGTHRLLREHGVWTMSVAGTHHEMGLYHGKLTTDLRKRLEADTIGAFARAVPHPLARAAILEGVMLAGAGLDAHVDRRWREEIGGLAASSPDPLAWTLPAYTRKLYLHALHDIGQALVDSPLVACTGFLAGGTATVDGHWILARNFDFEGGRVFDDEKIVMVRHPDEGLASVSVSFPGMVGVVSGINEARIAVALQAAGSDTPIRMAEPMTLVLRQVLEEARSLDDVEAILAREKGFATELVLAVDGTRGEAALFEITPERVERLPAGDLLPVSNHLRAPAFADDAENHRRQLEQTTTPRLERMTELVEARRGRLTLPAAIDILRDRAAPGGAPLPRGHRWALDADIASHAVAIDATAGELWVSVSPNLSGGFVGYRLDDLLAGELSPRPVVAPSAPAAALATHRARDLLREAGRLPAREAESRLREALHYLPGHPEILLALAELLVTQGQLDEARLRVREAEAAPPENAEDRARLAALKEAL